MRHRTTFRLLVAAGATAALALPGVAVAATYTHRDATHDVQRYNLGDRTLVRADHNRSADITKVSISYTRRTLDTVFWVRSGSVRSDWLYEAQIRTSDHTRFELDLSVGTPDHRFELKDSSGTDVVCDGMTRHVARAKSRIRVTVPSSCLHRPDWVRSSAAFGYTVKDSHQFADDGLRKRGLTEDPRFALTPRLHLRSS